jgi:hypothetical protein
VLGAQRWPSIRERVWPSTPSLTVATAVEQGGTCGPSFAAPGTYRLERRVLDVTITNPSRRDVTIKRVRLVPGWLTGGFYAGEIAPGMKFDVALDEWMGMLVIAQGHSDRREAGQAALVDKGYAKKQDTNAGPIWWIKPDPIEVKPLPAPTVKRGSDARFRIALGLRGPKDAMEGPAHLEVEVDSGPPVRSEWFSLAVCTPEAAKR